MSLVSCMKYSTKPIKFINMNDLCDNSKAREFFTREWGTGFTKATLSEKNGFFEMSMEDVYSTMESYAEFRLQNLVGEDEQSQPCKYVKRIGESCTLNNNCKYPNCE